ncbi:hypothetical protein [Cytobacillus firmus]|uniref:hypothetical protein n=1 Tax=Cytobacillus firmus TaxID=1399 RepID=UPI0018CCC179|nr:hypothetical protein [Cytobacillus firmus]MBG9587681.1 hypothetical protein [Cytobacillus firmus]
MPIQYLHYLITGMFFYIIYSTLVKSLGLDKVKSRYSLRNKLRKSLATNGFLAKYFYNDRAEEFINLTGLFKLKVNSIQYNFIRHISLYVAVWTYFISSFIAAGQFSLLNLLMVLGAFVLTSPLKLNIFFDYVLKNLAANHKRKMNAEVYSLYAQLKTEFQTRKVGNIYGLLFDYRNYFKAIKPAIEEVLYKWSESPDKAWEAFSKRIGTEEAKTLAIIMKEVEYSSQERSLALLEQKRDQFANSNYNAYRNYLKAREMILYIVIFSTASGAIVLNMVVVFMLFFKDIMGAANNIFQM